MCPRTTSKIQCSDNSVVISHAHVNTSLRYLLIKRDDIGKRTARGSRTVFKRCVCPRRVLVRISPDTHAHTHGRRMTFTFFIRPPPLAERAVAGLRIVRVRIRFHGLMYTRTAERGHLRRCPPAHARETAFRTYFLCTVFSAGGRSRRRGLRTDTVALPDTTVVAPRPPTSRT